MATFTKKQMFVEKLEDMKAKLRRLDGDAKAYHETSLRYVEEARAKICALRNQIQDLRHEYNERSDTSELIMDQAFQKNKDNLMRMANQPAEKALEELDYDVSSKLNALNDLRYQTITKMKRLADVESEVNAIRSRIGKGSYFTEQEMNLIQLIRIMENKLDKTSAKIAEAIHIKHAYEVIRDKLISDSSTYTMTLEAMAAEIRQCSAKLTDLKERSAEAAHLRDRTFFELKEHEQLLFAHQKRQELELFNMKRTLNLLKEQPIPTKALPVDDDIEKSDVNDQLTGEDPSASDGQSMLIQLEAIYSTLKAVTGASDSNEIEELFIQFEQSTASLHKLSEEVGTRVELLKSQNGRLKEILQGLRSIGSAKTSGNLTQTTAQTRMTSLNIRMNAMRSELGRLRQLLTCVHLAVEHIYVKLQMTPSTSKGAKKQAAVILRHLVEIHLPDLMLQCLDYQDQLDNDLDDYNLAVEIANMLQEESVKLMHTDQFNAALQRKIPRHNTRVAPNWMRAKKETDEEDNAEWRSRDDLKHRSAYMTLVNKHHPSKR